MSMRWLSYRAKLLVKMGQTEWPLGSGSSHNATPVSSIFSVFFVCLRYYIICVSIRTFSFGVYSSGGGGEGVCVGWDVESLCAGTGCSSFHYWRQFFAGCCEVIVMQTRIIIIIIIKGVKK